MKKGTLRISLFLWTMVFAPGFARGATTESTEPRNFIMITVDTLRADRLGAYHYDRAKTPALDALAAESVVFENAYAHASITLPSVASLMTGRLPGGHKVYENGGQLPEQMPTLATMFRRKKFQTAGFVGNWALRPSRRLNRGFQSYTRGFRNTEGVRDHPENRAEPLTDLAIRWLEERTPDQRFFLWIHYQDPHGPYEPPTFDAPSDDAKGLVLPEGDDNWGKNSIPEYQWLGHGNLNEYQARYDGEIAETDRNVSRVLEVLRKKKLMDESVILFTADHGEAFGEEETYCAHGTGLSDALLHVPLFLRVPGRAPERRRDRVRLIDVLPTAAELFDMPTPKLRGRSLLRDEGDRPVVAQIGKRPTKRWRSVRIGDHEVREQWRKERQEFGSSAENGQDLRTALKMLKDFAPWPPFQKAPKISDKERKALEALGYIDWQRVD